MYDHPFPNDGTVILAVPRRLSYGKGMKPSGVSLRYRGADALERVPVQFVMDAGENWTD